MTTITPELREAFEKKFCDEKGNWADGIITAYEVMLFCAEREALARAAGREGMRGWIRKEVEEMAYYQNMKGALPGGPYRYGERLRGPNEEEIELINKYAVLALLTQTSNTDL